MIPSVEHTQLIPVLIRGGGHVCPGDYLICAPRVVELGNARTIEGFAVLAVCGDPDESGRVAAQFQGGTVVTCTVEATGGALIVHRADGPGPAGFLTVAACSADGIAAELSEYACEDCGALIDSDRPWEGLCRGCLQPDPGPCGDRELHGYTWWIRRRQPAWC